MGHWNRTFERDIGSFLKSFKKGPGKIVNSHTMFTPGIPDSFKDPSFKDSCPSRRFQDIAATTGL